jgi:hypothetical protein
MKKVTLHVGLEKTGTSYLQSAFEGNRRKLARTGIHYPKAGIESGHHYWIAKALEFRYQRTAIDAQKEATALRLLQKEYARSDAEHFLLSSEHFDVNLNDANSQALVRLFGDVPVEVVLVLRNQLDYARSRYLEHIKWGGIRTFADFLDLTSARNIYDFEARVDIWQATGATVKIVDYDQCRDVLLQEFLQCAGLQAPVEKLAIADAQPNVTPAVDFMELVRLSNIGIEPQLRRGRYHKLLALAEGELAFLTKRREWPFPDGFRSSVVAMQESNWSLARRLDRDPKTFLGGALLDRFKALREYPPPNIHAVIDKYIYSKNR